MGSPPHPRLRSRAGCLQKQSLELCVSDHFVGVQGPHSSSIVRYVCTFQPSNLINGLCKNREVQSLKESLLFLLCFNLAYNKPVDEMVTSRLVSEGTGQRLDSAREPGVCPWSSECVYGAWSVSTELRACARSLECVHGAQSVSLEPGSGVWPGYQRTEAGHWLQPRMGCEIPKAGSAPGSAPGHGLSPAASPAARFRACQATEMPPQPSVTHASAAAACTLPPPQSRERGGLAHCCGGSHSARRGSHSARRGSPLPRGAP